MAPSPATRPARLLLPPVGVALLLLVVLALSGCGSPTTSGRDVTGPPDQAPATDRGRPADDEGAAGPAWFEDVTDKLGLDFVHDPGPTGTYFMPPSMGSGPAFIHDTPRT